MSLCACGCGQQPKEAKSRYCHGHWAKTSQGRNAISGWKYRAAQSQHGDGYLSVRKNGGGGNDLEHIVIAESVIGRTLPVGVEVHHVNEDRSDNRNRNLVICQDRQYHRLLHVRMRAFKVCGDVNWRKCCFCKQYDDPSRLYIPQTRGTIEHRACGREYRRARKVVNRG